MLAHDRISSLLSQQKGGLTLLLRFVLLAGRAVGGRALQKKPPRTVIINNNILLDYNTGVEERRHITAVSVCVPSSNTAAWGHGAPSCWGVLSSHTTTAQHTILPYS